MLHIILIKYQYYYNGNYYNDLHRLWKTFQMQKPTPCKPLMPGKHAQQRLPIESRKYGKTSFPITKFLITTFKERSNLKSSPHNHYK